MPSAPSPPLAGAVIAFDLDGTLVDTAPDLIGTLNQILAEHGHEGLPLSAARTVVGRGARVLLERGFAAVGEALSPDRQDLLFREFVRLYRGRIAAESRPYPGVVHALSELADAGAKLAVCTNKPTELSIDLLRALGLAGRFAAIIGPDAAGYAKPDPRHLIAAIEAAGGATTRALMVGDAVTDRDAARAARTPVALVTYGYAETPAAELDPDLLLDDLTALPAAAVSLLGAQRPAISRSLR